MLALNDGRGSSNGGAVFKGASDDISIRDVERSTGEGRSIRTIPDSAKGTPCETERLYCTGGRPVIRNSNSTTRGGDHREDLQTR